MGYETGQTTSYADLQTRIHTFLQANGWTLSGLVIHKGSVFARLTANSGDLRVHGGQGEAAGDLVTPSPGYGRLLTACYGSDVVFPATYHLFVHTNPDLFLCVLNYATLNCQWLTFGELNKVGNWQGGQYYGASYSSQAADWQLRFYNYYCHKYNTNSAANNVIGLGYFWAGNATKDSDAPGNLHMVCDLDGSAGDWVDNHGMQGGINFNGSFLARDLVPYGPNTFNSQSTLVPVHIYASRPDAFSSVLGEPWHTRYFNMKHHSLGDIITLGPEKWMVFPHQKKSDNALTNSGTSLTNGDTGVLGFAVRYDGP